MTDWRSRNSRFPHWECPALADISKTYFRLSFQVCSEQLIKIVERKRGVSLKMEWWQIRSNASKWKAPQWYYSPMQFFPNHWQSVTHVNFKYWKWNGDKLGQMQANEKHLNDTIVQCNSFPITGNQ